MLFCIIILVKTLHLYIIQLDYDDRIGEKMKKVNQLYLDNLIDYTEYKMVIDSYTGHLSYGNCNNLIHKFKLCKNIELGKDVKID